MHVIFILYMCVTSLNNFFSLQNKKGGKVLSFFFFFSRWRTLQPSVFFILNLLRFTRVHAKQSPIPPASALQALLINEPAE